MVQGVHGSGSQQAQLGATQQSLFASKSSGEADSSGSVREKAQVHMLDESLQQQESQALKLIQSSMGLGQNVDVTA